MTRLRVTLHGQVLTELVLQLGQEYFAGRGSQSHILLANERGISRQHVKFFHDGQNWVAQLVSKYGGMIYEGQTVETLPLSGSLHFMIPPYHFEFSDSVDQPVDQPLDRPEATSIPGLEMAPTQIKTQANTPEAPSHTDPFAKVEALDLDPEHQTRKSNTHVSSLKSMTTLTTAERLDRTFVGASRLTAYVKVLNRKTNSEEVLKLDGHMWTFGRHTSCEVTIEDSSISRKHFDLTKTTEGYFLTAHESKNPTKLNNEALASGQRRKITSGDVIKIRHVEIHFELRDNQYMEQLASLPASSTPNDMVEFQTLSGAEDHLPEVYETGRSPMVVRIPPGRKSRKGLKPVHFIIGLGIVVILFGLFSNNPKSNPPSGSGPNAQNPSSTADLTSMTPDKKNEIIDTFNLAQNYYIQRKYVLCLSQVEKLHGLVAFHANSKELESLCKQARELEQIEQDRRRKEEARAEAENMIRKTVQECKKTITSVTTSEQLNNCLSPAIELDPQHGLITDLQSQVLVQENEKQDRQAKQQDLQRRKQAGQSAYNRALNLEKAGQLKAAINEYKKFLAGQYPGLNQESDNAKRSLASIEQSLEQRFQQAVSECQSAFERGNIKETLLICDKSLQAYPGNKDIRAVKEKALANLQRELKPIYEDSRIEESLGNIEAAKEKWLKIVEKSVPQDSYYQKAKSSLKKYGL
jgi:tetratricopeptide (TPR) repeat protein